MAQRHVALGESLVADQRGRVCRLQLMQANTAIAEELLSLFEETLATMREHLVQMQSEPQPTEGLEQVSE